jgi:hypothetical protein
LTQRKDALCGLGYGFGMTKAIAVAILALAGVARAADYSDDDLCRAIGETSAGAVQPRDRLFLEQKCHCYSNGCAASGSPRDQALLKRQQEEAAAREKRRAAEQAAAAKRKASLDAADRRTEPLRRDHWVCILDQGADCTEVDRKLREACEATGQYGGKGDSLDWRLCSGLRNGKLFPAYKAEAEKNDAVRRAALDRDLVQERAVYWACVRDPSRSVCGPEIDAMRAVCGVRYDFDTCAGPKQ